MIRLPILRRSLSVLIACTFLVGCASNVRSVSNVAETASGERVIGLVSADGYYMQVYTSVGRVVYQTRVGDTGYLSDTHIELCRVEDSSAGETVVGIVAGNGGHFVVTESSGRVFTRRFLSDGHSLNDARNIGTIPLGGRDRVIGATSMPVNIIVTEGLKLVAVPLDRDGNMEWSERSTLAGGGLPLSIGEQVSGIADINGSSHLIIEKRGAISVLKIEIHGGVWTFDPNERRDLPGVLRWRN